MSRCPAEWKSDLLVAIDQANTLLGALDCMATAALNELPEAAAAQLQQRLEDVAATRTYLQGLLAGINLWEADLEDLAHDRARLGRLITDLNIREGVAADGTPTHGAEWLTRHP